MAVRPRRARSPRWRSSATTPGTSRSSGPAGAATSSACSTRNLAVGLSYGWWIDKHNRHHAHPNEIGSDPDIGTGALVFIPGAGPPAPASARLLTRAQAYLFFPLLLLEGLNLHVAGLLALAGAPGQRPLARGSAAARARGRRT